MNTVNMRAMFAVAVAALATGNVWGILTEKFPDATSGQKLKATIYAMSAK
jgi:hypothetical protein